MVRWFDITENLTGTDLLGMVAGFVFCLLVSLALGHKRIFWEDEMLGWMLLRDPSFHHMVQAWNMGADGGGFTFYLTGRAWFFLFGPSIISFRFFSATCFGVAFCVMWIAARRFYAIKPVAFSLCVCWFVSASFVLHMGEGRFYGLLVLGTTLLVWLVSRTSQAGAAASARTPGWLYLLAFSLNGLLTTSHLLGVVYSGVLLLALVVLDWRAGRLRPWLYASGALSWLLLIPERHAIRASAAVGKPWFWTIAPNAEDFGAAFVGFSAIIAFIMLVLAGCFAFSLLRTRENPLQAVQRGFRERAPMYVIAAALFLVPIVFAIEAWMGGTSLFTERYLVPVMIAPALLSMELIQLTEWDRVFAGRSRILLSPRSTPVLTGLFALALVLILRDVRLEALGSPEYYIAKLSARVPRGVPVVCEDAWAFVDLISREHDSGIPYTYLLDWDYSASPDAPKLEVTQYHLMENWKKVGYFSGSIRYRDEFLRNQDMFVLLNPKRFPIYHGRQAIGNPLVDRFRTTAGYDTRLLSSGKSTAAKDLGIDQGYDVWLVCRGTCPR